MLKKIIITDFAEYHDKCCKLGNYHYAKAFARDGYEVLWMSNLWNFLTYFVHKETYYVRKSLSSIKRHKLDKNIYGFAPKSLLLFGNYPFLRNDKIVFNNYRYIFPDIKKSLKKLKFNKVDILWISHPKQFWLTKVVNYDKFIYRIPDDFHDSGQLLKSLNKIENALIDKSDHVFITAENLRKKVECRNKKAYFLPNGTDFLHFNKSKQIPLEYLKSNKKRIIYIGAIGYWFDEELIKYIALNLDLDIYIIGTVHKDLAKIEGVSNIRILGPKPYEDIPDYLNYADVAIIPFIKNDFTDTINPIKLYEYCSTGIGVVTTNLEEVKNMNPPIYIAKNYDDFLKGIEYYLFNSFDKNKIIEFGKSNSWDERYKYVKKVIRE